MKRIFVPVFLIIVFANVLYFVVFSGKTAPKDPFNKSALIDEHNNLVSFKDFKGKVLIVSYFQSWCKDCRLELPELMELQKKTGDQLKIIIITDETFEISNQVRNYLRIDLPFYRSEKTLKEIGLRKFPTTYLLNKKGEVVDVKMDDDIHWNTKEIQDKILKLNQ